MASFTLLIKWRGQNLELCVNNDTSILDVRQQVEEKTEVEIEKQKYTPNVLPSNDMTKKLGEIKYFQARKTDSLKLLLIGTPKKAMEDLNKVVKKAKQSDQVSNTPRSEGFKKFVEDLGKISTLIKELESEIDSNEKKNTKAEKYKKLKLKWIETLTQIQLKLDSLKLPTEGTISVDEKQELRKNRKEAVLYAEKLILSVENS